MTAAGWVALAITVFGAFSYGAASILQAVAARRSTGAMRTLGHPLYLIGIGCDMLAWVGSMIALRELAVYLVESILAGSLAVTVVAARVILKSRLRKRDTAAVVVSVAALTVLAMSAGPQEDVVMTGTLRWGLCAAAMAVVVIGRIAARAGSAGIVAALAGLSLGGAALVGRSLSMPEGAMQGFGSAALAILTEPLVAALLTFAVTGMMLYASALQLGDVGPVTAVHWTAEVITPSAVALVLLGDTVRPGWGTAAVIAGVVTVGSAVLLATAPANKVTAQPPDALPARRSAATAGAPGAARPAPVRHAERIIWWGPPPIWTPPQRAKAVLAAPSMAELTWNPPHAEARWADPTLSSGDPAEIPRPVSPAPAGRSPDHPAELVASRPQPARLRPWHDL